MVLNLKSSRYKNKAGPLSVDIVLEYIPKEPRFSIKIEQTRENTLSLELAGPQKRFLVGYQADFRF